MISDRSSDLLKHMKTGCSSGKVDTVSEFLSLIVLDTAVRADNLQVKLPLGIHDDTLYCCAKPAADVLAQPFSTLVHITNTM